MLIIAYCLTVISALLGLGVGLLGGLASYLILSNATVSFTSVDFIAGVGVLVVTLLYAAHPLIALQLIKHGYLVGCYVYDALFIAASIALFPLLGNSLSVASV